MPREHFRFATTILAASLISFSGPAVCQKYPTKPVRLLVGFAPGGTTDVVGRVIGRRLTEALGQQAIVENRPGAASNIATELAAKAPPDGYTLLVVTPTQTVNATLYKKLSYDLVADFAPVSQVVTSPHLLAVHPALPVRITRDLIDLAKRQPGALNFGNAGDGSTPHMAAVLFSNAAKIQIVHIPYRGQSPAMSDFLAGQTQVMFTDMIVASPSVKAGRLRALAMALPAGKRASLMPELPTISESALPGFETGSWVGVLAPARTSKSVTDVLYKEISRGFMAPEVMAQMAALGLEVVTTTPDAFASTIKSEIKKWGEVVREIRLSVE